jgi:NDP-sugar pyrophosphorylase family protein
MLPVGDMPILEIIIAQLSHYGFKEITLSVGYLAGLIRAYFQANGNLPDSVTLDYVKEDTPLGTAGPLSLIPNLDETFLVMNGDVLTTLDYSKLVAYHRKQGAALTIATYPKNVHMNFGMVEVDSSQRVTNYLEKPTFTYDDSMGIYVYEPSVLNYIESGGHLDVPALVLRLLKHGERVIACRSEDPCYWIDMGQHGDYEKAIEVFEARRDQFLPVNGKKVRPAIIERSPGRRKRQTGRTTTEAL